jgi:hypothetical protein
MEAFLVIDGQPLSLARCLRYLQAGDKAAMFVGEILRQHVLERELEKREDIGINPALVALAEADFRAQHQLADQRQLEEWLAANGQDYASFHRDVVTRFKLEKLKYAVTEPQLAEHFRARKPFLDQVVLSWIAVPTRERALELRAQLEQGADFAHLAYEHLTADESLADTLMVRVHRVELPSPLCDAVEAAERGAILGPIRRGDRWELFRFEQDLPVSLEQVQLRHALRDELFECWLGERIESCTIDLHLGEEP